MGGRHGVGTVMLIGGGREAVVSWVEGVASVAAAGMEVALGAVVEV